MPRRREPINLKEQISDVGIQVGDPAILKFRKTEIVHWLNTGNTILGHLLWDVDAWEFETSLAQNTTNGTAAYTLPRDYNEATLVRVDTNASGTLRQAIELPLRDRGALTENTFYEATAREPFYSLTGSALTIYPTPTATVSGGLEITYRRKPPVLTLDRIRENVAATSNGAAGGTTIISTNLTERDDFWNECEVEPTSGTYDGERRIVSDFVNSGGTLTLRNAFSGQIASGVTFSLFDRSILPEEYHYIVVLYAVAMAYGKLGMQDKRQATLAEFQGHMAAIKDRFTAPVQKQLYDGERMSKTAP